MGQGGNDSGAGACLFCYNVFFTLAGVAVLAVGIWIRYEESVEYHSVILGALADEYLYGASYILIGIGAFALMIGVLGCCGAHMENNCLLSCLIEELVPNLKVTIAGYQPKLGNKAENAVALGWDYVQVKHECCGATNYTDYGGIFSHSNVTHERKGVNEYDKVAFNDMNSTSPMTVRVMAGLESNGSNQIYVPKSCCVLTNSDPINPQPVNYDKCNEAASTPDNIGKDNEFLWTKNCTQGIKDTIGEKMDILTYLGVGIAFLQFFWITLACCKCDGPGNKGFCVLRCRLNCK